MAFYDRIAKQWQTSTGYKGGAFKELILNDLLIDKIPGIIGSAILELGVGNGYFMPLLLRRFSGQKYARMVLTDQSGKMLQLELTTVLPILLLSFQDTPPWSRLPPILCVY
jgi:hypothetical protein